MIKDKPAIVAALAIIVGIIAARFTSLSWIVWCVAGAVAFVTAIFQYFHFKSHSGRRRSPALSFLILLIVSAGASYSINHELIDPSSIIRYVDLPDSLVIHCRVIDQPRISNGKTSTLVEIFSLGDENDSVKVHGKAYLTIHPDKRRKESVRQIEYGSIISLKSILQSPVDSRNPGEFSYKKYLELNDIYATALVFGYSKIQVSEEQKTNFLFEKIIFPSKDFVTKNIMSVMNGDEAYFLVGLLLGDRADISQEIKTAFMNTGTIHVLAVSGSHVILVVAIVFTLFGLLRFPRKLKIAATIVVLIYYTFLTGATPSVVRASLMAIAVLLGKYFEERVNVYNALGASAVIILLIEPKQLFDVGFQLSFSAVFSIVYFYPKLNMLITKIPEPLEEFRMVEWLWQAFAVSLAAQIGTIPFTAYYFGKVSLVSFAANLIVVPLVGVLVTVGLSGVLVGILSSYISTCFFEVNQVIAWFTLKAVRLAELVPYATINTSLYGLRETIFYSAIVGFVFNLRNKEVVKKIILATFFLLTVIFSASLFNEDKNALRLIFLDVGQGDAVVIQFPSGHTMLIDGGPIAANYDAGERIVAPFLTRNGISEVDAILTTHPHSDHLGGIPYLLKHFSVKSVIDQDQAADSKLFQEYMTLRHLSSRQMVTAGTMINSFPNVRLYCLHPIQSCIDRDSLDGYSNLNESSIVLKLVYGKTSFLLTGDAEVPSEEEMIYRYGDFLDSDIIKAGHHGSITSSSEEFISRVTPQSVVVSVGKFNKFRHPSKLVMGRYRSMNVKIYRTDENGAIVFESDGNAIKKIDWKSE